MSVICLLIGAVAGIAAQPAVENVKAVRFVQAGVRKLVSFVKP